MRKAVTACMILVFAPVVAAGFLLNMSRGAYRSGAWLGDKPQSWMRGDI